MYPQHLLQGKYLLPGEWSGAGSNLRLCRTTTKPDHKGRHSASPWLETRVFYWEVPHWYQGNLLGSDHRGAVGQAMATEKCHWAGQKNWEGRCSGTGKHFEPWCQPVCPDTY